MTAGAFDHQLRARTVSELVDAAFALYRRNALQYIQVTALAYAPWLVMQIIFQGGTSVPTGQMPGTRTLLVTLALSLGLGFSVVLMSAVIIKVGSQVYLGQEPDLGGAVREVAPRVGTIALASLLKYAVPFIVMIVVGTVLILASSTLFVSAGFRFGPVVLVMACSMLGFFYVFARYFAVTPVIVLEGGGAWDALGRSSTLSRGRKRHVLNALLLVGVIYVLLGLGIHLLLQVTGSLVIQLVVSTMFTIVAYPIIGLTQMLLYYDARIRSEGFDIEMMAGALDLPPLPGGAVT